MKPVHLRAQAVQKVPDTGKHRHIDSYDLYIHGITSRFVHDAGLGRLTLLKRTDAEDQGRRTHGGVLRRGLVAQPHVGTRHEHSLSLIPEVDGVRRRVPGIAENA